MAVYTSGGCLGSCKLGSREPAGSPFQRHSLLCDGKGWRAGARLAHELLPASVACGSHSSSLTPRWRQQRGQPGPNAPALCLLSPPMALFLSSHIHLILVLATAEQKRLPASGCRHMYYGSGAKRLCLINSVLKHTNHGGTNSTGFICQVSDFR